MYYPKERNNYPKGKLEQNSTTQKAKNNYPKAAEYYPKGNGESCCDVSNKNCPNVVQTMFGQL